MNIISRFINALLRARLAPSHHQLDVAYRTAAREAWRGAEAGAWRATDSEGWPD